MVGFLAHTKAFTPFVRCSGPGVPIMHALHDTLPYCFKFPELVALLLQVQLQLDEFPDFETLLLLWNPKHCLLRCMHSRTLLSGTPSWRSGNFDQGFPLPLKASTGWNRWPLSCRFVLHQYCPGYRASKLHTLIQSHQACSVGCRTV